MLLILGCTKDQKCDDPISVNYEESSTCLYVDSTQKALYFKFTGTWCPPCGASGAIKMRQDIKDNVGSIGVEVHYNDEMASDICNKFVSHFGNTTFPSFYVNNDEGALPTALSTAPIVGMVIDHSVSDNEMSISCYMKALDDIPDKEYYIAVYILEDGHIAEQYATDHSAFPALEYRNGRYPKYVHDRILRAEVSGNIFGQSFYKGVWHADETRSYEVKFDLPEGTTGVLYPVVGLWERSDRTNFLINASSGLQ